MPPTERCWKCGADVPNPDVNTYKHDYVFCGGCGQIHFVRKPAEWRDRPQEGSNAAD